VPFEGGTGNGIAVDLGSGSFIPGFEEQIAGMKVGETRTVNAQFPIAYANEALAGKAASFETVAKSIEKPGTVDINEEFAKGLGLESLDKLKDAVRERISKEHDGASRTKVKRQLLDQLDAMHSFEPPPTLVADEFEQIWKQVTSDLQTQGRTLEDEGTTEEKAKAEYQAIAQRRVRLGLVLAEIGEKNKITVSDEEVTKAVVERARQFPGQEQRIWEHYRSNPQALAGLRAPIFEEKVVDFLLELAAVTDKKVSREELYKDDEADTAAAAS
jgi:trigger factor